MTPPAPAPTAVIQPVSAPDTLPIRRTVLRPGFPPESAVFEGDLDSGTLHFGAFLKGHLVGVASLYDVPLPGRLESALQLRGMATLPEVRGSRIGIQLLAACYDSAWNRGISMLWCNARETALGFYAKQGWAILGERFEIPTVGPHFRMLRRLEARGMNIRLPIPGGFPNGQD